MENPALVDSRPEWLDLPDFGEIELPPAPVRPLMKRVNQAAAWGIGILSIAGIVSMTFSRFVPSPTMVEIAKASAILAGLLYCGFFAGVGSFGWNRNNPQTRAYVERHPFMGKAFVRGPVMGAVMAMFAWMSFANVFPWALNAVIGRSGTMWVTIDGWQNATHGRGATCAHPTLRGVPMGMRGARALCYRDSDEVYFLRGTKLILVGRVSPLGIAEESARFPTVADEEDAEAATAKDTK